MTSETKHGGEGLDQFDGSDLGPDYFREAAN